MCPPIWSFFAGLSNNFSCEPIPGGYSEARLACSQGKPWERNERFQLQALGFDLGNQAESDSSSWVPEREEWVCLRRKDRTN